MGQEAGLSPFVQSLHLCALSFPVNAVSFWAPADNILQESGVREKLPMEWSCKKWLALGVGGVYFVGGRE